MLDLDTFLTTLYVMADDFCKSYLGKKTSPGPSPSLEAAEVITLAIWQQHWRFRSEKDFYRYVQKHMKGYFPKLPDYSQYNRLARKHWRTLTAFWQFLVNEMQAQNSYEVLDTVPIPVRNIKRRGEGWLAGMTNIGWSTRLGWFEGFHGLISVNSIGVITGFCFGSASEKDQPMAETFLHLRFDKPSLLPTVGQYTCDFYLADNGFEGSSNYWHWRQDFGATVIAAPPRYSDVWAKSWRKWFSALRQIVETVYDKLENWLGLGKDRSHALSGFHLRFSAKATLHNFLIYLNLQLGRQPLAFADLVDW